MKVSHRRHLSEFVRVSNMTGQECLRWSDSTEQVAPWCFICTSRRRRRDWCKRREKESGKGEYTARPIKWCHYCPPLQLLHLSISHRVSSCLPPLRRAHWLRRTYYGALRFAGRQVQRLLVEAGRHTILRVIWTSRIVAKWTYAFAFLREVQTKMRS